MRGYKVFNNDWTCRGFQYEVGKTFEHEGNIRVCGSGFHFCRKISDCFNYYSFNSNNKVAEIDAIGLIESEGDKSVTDKIQIVRELTWNEVLELANEGKNNTGLKNTGNRNTGDRNTGDWNTGNCNTGNRNTGDCNTGDCNTGNWNTGNRNTGNCNTGDCNTGDCNTGDRNTGNWNTGDRNTGNCNTGDCNTGNCNTGDWNTVNNVTGVFCTEEQKIKIFDIDTDLTYQEWLNLKASKILRWNLELNVWIYEDSMIEEEKQQYPTYKTTGGYLKNIEFKEACKNMWNNITEEEKQEVLNIPNFNKDKFKFVTGIEV